MTTLNPSPANCGIKRRGPATLRPLVSAGQPAPRPLPSLSFRVPVTPANRSYLRELRAAELRAWHNPPVARAQGAVNERSDESHRERKELFSFAVIVALTLTLAGVVLAQSAGVTRQYEHLASFVRHFFG